MKKILPVFLAMLLAGCGGGGSNDSGPPAPIVNGTTSTTGSGTTTTSAGGTTSTSGTGTTTTSVGGTTSTTGSGTTTTSSSGATTTTIPIIVGTTSTTNTTTTTTVIGAPSTSAPGNAGTTGATTQIVGVRSGKCLDVTGGPTATGNGVPIEQWTCSGQSNQAWTVKSMGGPTYEIIAGNSGKCLDIVDSNPARGTAVQQKDCTGQPNQLWNLASITAGQFHVHSVLNDTNCLSIRDPSNTGTPTNDGAVIEAGECGYAGDPAHAWAMDVALPIRYHGTKNECLHVRGGSQANADGTLTEIAPCTGLGTQFWTMKAMGNRQYQLIDTNSGKCLALVNGDTTVGNNTQIAQCANTPTQLWTTSNIGLGMTMIITAADNNLGTCLDIVGGWQAQADGILTQLTKCTTYELWYLGYPEPWP